MTGLGGKRSTAGLTFGAAIVVFVLVGWWLDDHFGTSPTLLLIGFGLGAVGGFIHLVETVSPGTLFKARKKGNN